jgi:hypothetical protein
MGLGIVHGNGQDQLVQIVVLVNHHPVVEANLHFLHLQVQRDDPADVPVEHLLGVVVFDLHDDVLDLSPGPFPDPPPA